MRASWQPGASHFGGGCRRGSADASVNTSYSTSSGGGVSAVYAAASGMHPPLSERKKAETTTKRVRYKDPNVTPFLSSWLPQRLGKFDRPVVLRESDELPELLEGVFERNRALAMGSTGQSGNQSSLST